MAGESIKLTGHVIAECYGPDGNLKWREEGENLIVDGGLNWILENDIAAATGTLYIGLKDTGTPVAADTMASHASWATITPYSNATDPAWTEDATGSDEQVSNSASPAAFNINAADTVFGAFLKTDNTKGGTAGTLIGVKDFAASQGVNDGDTLNVTYTVAASSS